jgi:dUTP pyrophosphatase
MKIKIENKSKNDSPSYSTAVPAGMELRANIDSDVILKTLKRALISTGMYLEIMEGCDAQISSGSGLAIKFGVTVLNSPGTIKADYREKFAS